LNQKNLSSRNTKNKLNKNKNNRKLQEDEEEEDYPEEVVEEENEEEDEEDEEADNSFIVNDDESEGRNDINVYRDESIFKKKDKDIKTVQEADEEENPSDDQKDENYSEEDQKEQEEAELEENLNESDLEVAQEKKPKRKRKLHKVRDLDNEELKREYDELKEDLPKDDDYPSKQRTSSFDGSNDGYPKNRIKKKRNNLDNFQDYKKENRRNRDDDFIDYGDRPRPRHDREAERAEKIHLLEQEIISDEDRIIINADFPERLLIRYNLEELPILSQEIKPELEWICEQKNYIDSPAKKKKIITLLEFLKKDFLDIPYIVTYKYYIFEHDLTKRELWEIYELDKEYQKIMDLKKKVMNNFNTLEPFLNEKIYHNMKEKFIENAKSSQELRNMMNYINYNKEKYLSSNPNISTENKKAYQGPIRKSILSVCFSENLDLLSQIVPLLIYF
jgi:transcription elongation factor SPT6